MTERQPVLQLMDITKAYGNVVAIRDVSFSVQPGEVVGLVGPNGAGKTTAIHCLTGLIQPDRGRALIGGRRIGETRQIYETLGLAQQEIALFPTLTGRANLEFFASLTGRDRASIDQSVEALAEALDFTGLLSRRVLEMSMGQQRLLHVAAALVHEPRVVLLDEASAGLDIFARAHLADYLRRVASDGVAVLFSSHYLSEVETICSRAIFIHQGAILADDAVGTLVQKHGASKTEVMTAGKTIVIDGTDLVGAVQSLGPGQAIEAIRVIEPSLESAFHSLTGSRIGESGELAT